MLMIFKFYIYNKHLLIIMYERICRSCNKVMTYNSKRNKERADRDNTLCRTCNNSSRKGNKHPMFGKIPYNKGKKSSEETKKLISVNHADVSGDKNPMFGTKGGMYKKHQTEETKEKIGKGNKNKIVSEETKEKMSQIKLEYYKNNPNSRKGISPSSETRRKMRLSTIKRITECRLNGVQFYPTYNKKSIPKISEYGNLNNLNLVHAENGGEFFIKELGYWLDAYDVEKNIVVEFNEKHHKYQKDKDENRRNEIIKYLKCKFIILNEDGSINIY